MTQEEINIHLRAIDELVYNLQSGGWHGGVRLRDLERLQLRVGTLYQLYKAEDVSSLGATICKKHMVHPDITA
jgi:hypothetical protein